MPIRIRIFLIVIYYKFFEQDMPAVNKNAFFGLLHTGCRISELSNLTWDDVDMENKVIHIHSKENFTTKTPSSERVIPMNEALYNLLEDISRNKYSRIYPFCSIEGKQLRERKLLDVCKVIAARAGISSRAYLHKFRKTFTSQLAERGVYAERLQKLLGHASIDETLQYYTKLESGKMHEDVSKINDLIKPLE
jgi:integrase/recombinase XerD